MLITLYLSPSRVVRARLGPSVIQFFLILGLESVGAVSATTGLGVKLILRPRMAKRSFQESSTVIIVIVSQSHSNTQLGSSISLWYPFPIATMGPCGGVIDAYFFPKNRAIALNEAISG